MKLGDVLKLKVQNVSMAISKDDIHESHTRYGTVIDISMHKEYAEVALIWNGTQLIDSSGLGEIRLRDGTRLLVKLDSE